MAQTYVKALLEAQNHYCYYCHHEMPTNKKLQTLRNQPTRDHVEPRCHGGRTEVDNLVMACSQCNNIRGAMDAEVFYELVWHWFKRDSTLAQDGTRFPARNLST
jgi:5-methylcytosine-specific restriction endonuclease McrA